MTIKTVIYTLPSFLASALINSDESGLDDNESDYLNNWVDEKVNEHGGLFHCVGCEEYGFCWQHDYSSEGADCSKFTFHVNDE